MLCPGCAAAYHGSLESKRLQCCTWILELPKWGLWAYSNEQGTVYWGKKRLKKWMTSKRNYWNYSLSWHLQQGMTKMLKLGPIFTVQLNKNYWTWRRKPNTTSFKTVLLFFPLFNYFKYNISFLFIIFILTFWITPIEDAGSHLSVVQG